MDFREWIENRMGDAGNGEVFWMGEGNGASGILPICSTTGRIGLAWRSSHVQHGNCFGTIGGAIEPGMSPEESARQELKEETGFSGVIQVIPAYVFKSGSFSYHNFLGLVSSEFGLHPMPGHGWESDSLEWFAYDKILQELKTSPNKFHFGLVALFNHSRSLIEKHIKSKPTNRFTGTLD